VTVLRRALATVGWYFREVSGETAYDRYRTHRERQHPSEPVMTRAEFERWRMDDRDRNPRARCC
jgi:uncharacterized short protein YbdD (DUF466 family)